MKELSQEAIRKMDPATRAQYAQVQRDNKAKQDTDNLKANSDALRNSLNDLSRRVEALEGARTRQRALNMEVEAKIKQQSPKKSLLDLLLGK